MEKLKPWQWSLIFWVSVAVLLSVAGGYGIAQRVWGLKEQVIGMGRQQTAEEQTLQDTETEQMWLQRLTQRPPILDSMKHHSYINPPNRDIISQQMKALGGEHIQVQPLAFDPEKLLMADHEYSFCAQRVSAHFEAQDDRQVIAWLKEVESQVPGFFTLTSLTMTLGKEHTVTGDVVWEWSFLRLSLQSAS
jgi:hypothetical protein